MCGSFRGKTFPIYWQSTREFELQVNAVSQILQTKKNQIFTDVKSSTICYMKVPARNVQKRTSPENY